MFAAIPPQYTATIFSPNLSPNTMQDSALMGVRSVQKGLAHSVLGTAMGRMAEAQKLELVLRGLLPPAMAAAVRVYPSSSPVKTATTTTTTAASAVSAFAYAASPLAGDTFQLCCARPALLQKLRLMLPDLQAQLAQAGLSGHITALRLQHV